MEHNIASGKSIRPLVHGPSQCPGCGCLDQTPLESISLEEQHRLYAPQDTQVCRRLSEEARKSAASYQMIRCDSCGLEYASPMRAPNAQWYALAYAVLDLYPQTRWEFETCLRAIGHEDKLFEFGCGSGVFLELCRERDISAVGVDFLPAAVETCVQKGLRASTFEIGSPLPEAMKRSATQIVAFHVLEHLEQPRLLFEQAAYVARDGAQLWIAVPSDRRPTRQRGFVDFLDQPPHHMTRWNRSALDRIGIKSGWKLTQFQAAPLPLSTSLWWIATSAPHYRRWREQGKLTNRIVERSLRFASYPMAAIRRMTVDRKLTGFSMLATFSKT